MLSFSHTIPWSLLHVQWIDNFLLTLCSKTVYSLTFYETISKHHSSDSCDWPNGLKSPYTSPQFTYLLFDSKYGASWSLFLRWTATWELETTKFHYCKHEASNSDILFERRRSLTRSTHVHQDQSCIGSMQVPQFQSLFPLGFLY